MDRRPLSVMFGKDGDAIDLLIELHAIPGLIVDCTYGKGVMWKFSALSPDRKFDLYPKSPDIEEADCRFLPLDDDSVSVLVFDPPHLAAASASAGSSGIEREQYGLTGAEEWMQGESISPLFHEFCAEAKRVLTRNGVVLAKLADHVHNHRYQWVHIDLIAAARLHGLTPCDILLLCHPAAGNLKSSKWRQVRHLRRAHCEWIVLRNGRCESPSCGS